MTKQYDYDDVLIVPAKQSRFSSRSEVSPFSKYYSNDGKTSFELAPIIAANMDGVGTFEMADILSKNNIMTCLTKHYNRHDLADYFFSRSLYPNHDDRAVMTIGMSDADYDKFRYVKDKIPWMNFLTIDVANGHMESFANYIEKIREEFPTMDLIVGNVASVETFEILQDLGVWAVKVGIGPGAHCATREKTGVGRKMISLIEEVTNAATTAYVIADGGCKNPGDVAKALVAGADMVMLGTMFAGHTEGGGEPVLKFEHTGEYEEIIVSGVTKEYREIIRAVEYRQFYGMSSAIAMEKHSGGVAKHRTSEGKISLVRFKGGVQGTIDDIFGGLRSVCTYTNSSDPSELFFASFDEAL